MTSSACAQDPFEIHVYEYEPLAWREFSLEAHLNLLPTNQQTRLTLEPTFGLTENFAVGFMFLNAWEPGYTPGFAVGVCCRTFMRRSPGSCLSDWGWFRSWIANWSTSRLSSTQSLSELCMDPVRSTVGSSNRRC